MLDADLADMPETADTPRFFLLEDDALNAMILREYLDIGGYTDLTWVKSLADAEPYLSEFEEGKFDVALLDVTLGDGECWEFAKALKKLGTAPTCAYTARISLLESEKLDEAGFQTVFFKPVDLDHFLEEIDTLLGKARGPE